MTRVKRGTKRHKRHKKVIKLAKGYRMTRRKLYKKAKEAILHSGEYAYAGRKDRKSNFRRLWIIRLNAALREKNIKYSKFIEMLKLKKIELDRKILSNIAINYPNVFEKLVKKVFE